ncbi:Latrophilin-1, partial [Stegodyphus mimosarum]
MHYFSCWIKIGMFFAVTLARAHTTEPSMTDLKEMKRKWDECCKTNICIHNSCYSMEWRASGWSVIRQRCQSRYPDWPYAVDIFRIQNEDDVKILSEMFKDPPAHMADKIPIPTTIWTSGTRCPQVTSQGIRLVTRWTSSNHSFPEWLENKVSVTSTSITGNIYSCQFLVISTSGSEADIKYDFQEQSTRNVAICEFSLLGDTETTTTRKRTEISTTEADITSTIIEEGITSSSAGTDATSTSMKTDNIPSSTKELGSTSTVTTFITTAVTFMKSKTFAPGKLVSQESSKQQIVTITMEPVVANSTFTNALTSTAKPKYCKQTEEAGIMWPDTEAGAVANISCPEGMIGYAQWKCDERTLEFIPNKPHIQDCKHVWIKNLEDSVKKREDAVKISYKLAEQTRYQDMSHGDISALVDLSAKVLHLYSEQKGEEEYEIAGTQKKPPVSYNFTRSMVASFSNILRAEIKKAWEILPEIHQTRVASKILMLVTTMGSRLSCIRMSQDKLQFTVKEENIDLQTFILDNKKKDEVDVIVFPQEVGGVKASSLISLSSDLGLKNRLSPCTNYNSAVGVIYNNVGDFLKDQK